MEGVQNLGRRVLTFLAYGQKFVRIIAGISHGKIYGEGGGVHSLQGLLPVEFFCGLTRKEWQLFGLLVVGDMARK